MRRNKWKAAMPREIPPKGRADVVLAIRSAGSRLEYVGNMPTETAQKIMALLIELNAPPPKAPDVS
ncbi:MAG: hypothetical protein Q7S87_03210 [Agitococcus sp.]|nr:hypothetical protein [Agitococcus sp.]MDO9178645.1 hypothetical protein [Agitococcus sp.]